MDLHQSACNILRLPPGIPGGRTQRLEAILFSYRSMLTYPVIDAFTTMLHLGIPPGHPSSCRVLRYVLFGDPSIMSATIGTSPPEAGKDLNGMVQELKALEPVISEAYACFVHDMAEVPEISELRLHMVPFIDKSFESLMVEATTLFRRVFDRHRVVSAWIGTSTSHIFSS